MSKHSPGPWHQGGDVLLNNVYDAAGGHVATATIHDAKGALLGNARLIAAAPEMLELLRFLSTKSFYAENGEIDDGCGFCGGSGYHVGVCELAALLARIDP